MTSQTSGSFCSANRSAVYLLMVLIRGARLSVGTNYFTLYYSPWEMLLSRLLVSKHEGLMLREMELPQRVCGTHHHPLPRLCLPGLCFSLKQDFFTSLPSLVWRQLCWFQGESEARRRGKSDISLSGSFV